MFGDNTIGSGLQGGFRDSVHSYLEDRLQEDPEFYAQMNAFLDEMESRAVPQTSPFIPQYKPNRDPSSTDKTEDSMPRVLSLGSSLISSIGTRNPSIFAEVAIKQLLNKQIATQLKRDDTEEALGQKHANSREDRAIKILSKTPPVSVILTALNALFDDEFYGWEPESIMWELMDRGVQITQELFDRLNCAMCLAMQPAFLNDWHVFENCVLAMNGVSVHAFHIQKPDVAHICAAISEASMIFDKENKKLEGENAEGFFHPDIEMYVARVLQHDHYMLAPELVSFAQDELDKLNKNTHINDRLRAAWTVYQKELADGNPRVLEENIIDVQLHKLAGCHLYVQEHLKEIDLLLEELGA